MIMMQESLTNITEADARYIDGCVDILSALIESIGCSPEKVRLPQPVELINVY